MNSSRRNGSGFTLLEMLVTIVVLGIVLAVAMPSVKRYLESQRLRSVSGELSNDLQFARSEAVARGKVVGLRFEKSADQTCYTIAAYGGNNCLAPADAKMATCDCRLGAGAACSGSWLEIKTVVVSTNKDVGLKCHMSAGAPATDCSAPAPQNVAFDPTSGQISYCNPNLTGQLPPAFAVSTVGTTSGQLRTQIAPAGRARTCAFGGAVPGVPSC